MDGRLRLYLNQQVKIAKNLKLQYPFPEDPNYTCPICERTESEIKSMVSEIIQTNKYICVYNNNNKIALAPRKLSYPIFHIANDHYC